MKYVLHHGKIILFIIMLLTVSMLNAKDMAFLPYGDSKTRGVGDSTPPPLDKNGYSPILAKSTGFKELPRIARGGWTVAMMHKKLKQDLSTYKGETPDFVLINLGANDLGANKKSRYYKDIYQKTWEKQLGEICDEMKKKWPNVKIGLMRVWRRYSKPEITALNDIWIPNVAKSREWVFVGPDERIFLKGNDNGKTMTTDGIHPNRKGYEETAKQWAQLVKNRLAGNNKIKSLPGKTNMETRNMTTSLKNNALNKVTFLKPAPGPPVILVKNGKPESSIYVDTRQLIKDGKKEQAKIIKIAAEDLQSYIEQATGAKLPIVEEIPLKGNVILLGDNEITRKLGVYPGKMDKEAFVVKTAGNKLIIAGNDMNKKPRFHLNSGTMWGACDFLERYLGIRWYYPGKLGTIVPKTRDLIINPVYYKDSPEFGKRVIYRFHGTKFPGKRTPQFSDLHNYAHFRISDTSGVITPCHSPNNWGKYYGKSHPEYFQMGADGKRLPPMWCYSQPVVLNQFMKDLQRFYESDMKWHEPWGNWQKPTKDMIPLSPIDMPVSCSCPECKKLTNKGSQLGSASQIIGNFINKLCLEVKKKWPDKTVAFLPYMNYTLAPENIVFPDNLVVSLCWMRTMANLKEPEILEAEFKIRNDWQSITSKPMAHWLYTCWPSDCTKAPFQYPHVLKTFFNKTKGDAGFFCDAGVDWSRKHLTHYLMARLMWDPDFDVDSALKEYYSLMYGDAAETMSKYYTILIDRWENTRWKAPLPTYHRISLKNVHKETYPETVVGNLKMLINKALNEVDKNSIEHQRIAFVKKSFDPFYEESVMFHKGGDKRELQILRIGSMPKMDGKLDEDFWDQTPAAEFVTIKKDTPTPKYPTIVKGVWVPDHGVIFGFKMTESDTQGIKANFTKNDESVYMDDCIEIFLDPWAEQAQFFQIVSNFNGALYDAFYHNPGKKWNSEGIISKSFVGKGFWTMEIFIPFKTIKVKKVKTGTIWFGNFTRSRWRDKDKGGNELSRFSTSYNLGKMNSNLNTLNFGRIKFIE